jgi:hypothetical protein
MVFRQLQSLLPIHPCMPPISPEISTGGFGIDVVQADEASHLHRVFPANRCAPGHALATGAQRDEPRWASGTTQAALAQRQHTPLTVDQRAR